MNPRTITSAAHIDAITKAITALVSEYEILDGRMTGPARGRRTTAMEQVCGVTFNIVTADLDPYGMGDLDERLAASTLEWSLYVTDLMVAAMLDFREKAAGQRLRPESYRGRLIETLLDIWCIGMTELKRDPDDADASADEGDEEEGGGAGDLAA